MVIISHVLYFYGKGTEFQGDRVICQDNITVMWSNYNASLLISKSICFPLNQGLKSSISGDGQQVTENLYLWDFQTLWLP